MSTEIGDNDLQNSSQADSNMFKIDLRKTRTSIMQINGDQPEISILTDEEQRLSCDYELKYGSEHVIKLFIPISVCILMVVSSINTLPFYTKTDFYMVYTPYTNQTVDTPTKVWQSFANAFIFITFVAVMTVVFIVLYKSRFYRVINGWLILSSLLMLFIFTLVYIEVNLQHYNLVLDKISVYFFIWNFGILGMVAVHWKAPMILQQTYLLIISTLTALIFIKYIPEWTIWTVLLIVSIWDLIAVLCPKGPLRILVETAQKRNEKIFPSLIYSSGVVYIMSTHTNNSDNVDFENDFHENDNLHINNSFKDNDGIKLGLGDFIFYSILVGKASTYGNWNITLACYVAILLGLCLTLFLLAIIKTALPALPISITFGLIIYFSTSLIVNPFTNELSLNQFYI